MDLQPQPAVSVADFLVRLLIDIAAIFIFAVAIYFRRHTRKDLAALFAFFNIGLFIVVTVISQAEAATAIGFGLFAILSIIRLRSEPFNNRELGYFFGALVLGLLNGIATGPLAFTVILNVIVLAAIYGLDHPRVLQAALRRHITLDAIHTDPDTLRAALEQRLNATVLECAVTAIDYVKDTMELEVQYVEQPRLEALPTRPTTIQEPSA
ncbi:MAG: DUF4956 domain-containing protein [Chloroflexi bacterium]|nr:DUF4956 domain-containing protein [Chloroflexota bacterium]